MTDDQTQPIEVKASMAPGATWQTIRVVLIFGAGYGLSHFIENQMVVASGVAAVTAVLTYSYGLWERLKRGKLLRRLAHMLPDDKAVVK